MLKALLSGPIESQSDFGVGWREAIFSHLLELGITPLDPKRDLQMERPIHWGERERALKKAKAEHNEEDFLRIMHEIWVMNKRGVDEADFLIVYAEHHHNLSGGTLREMHEASLYGKPIFLVFSGDPWEFKSHPLGLVLQNGRFFKSLDELFMYLKDEVVPRSSVPKHHLDLFQVSQKVLILNASDELLILKDAHNPFYDLPGGRLNVEEFSLPLEESLQREVAEELGVDLSLTIFPRPVFVARDQLWDKILQQFHYRRVFLVFYEAIWRTGEINLCSEHEFYRWVPFATFDPRGLFKPGIEEALSEYLQKKRAYRTSVGRRGGFTALSYDL